MAQYSFSDLPDRLIAADVDRDLSMVVCIPSYNEDAVDAAVNSIVACHIPEGHAIEVIVLINAPEGAHKEIINKNLESYKALSVIESHDRCTIYPILVHTIPKKKSGVGRARKLAMDEAALRLSQSFSDDKVIACYDADCSCDENYITAVINHFQCSDKEAVSIHYEHPAADLMGDEIQKAIYLYELHLRYFIQYQQMIGLPFAYQTVGSSMACSLSGYRRIGGMNTRQAGEDFYFLHKFIKDDQCNRLYNTTVYPSARESDRVPFGTGRAIGEMLASQEAYLTYHPSSFEHIRCIIDSVDQIYKSDVTIYISNTYDSKVKKFLQGISFNEKLDKIRNNTTSIERFRKAFYQFFDAFVFMKYLHFMRDHYFEDIDVLEAASILQEKFVDSTTEASMLLHYYRSKSIESSYPNK